MTAAEPDETPEPETVSASSFIVDRENLEVRTEHVFNTSPERLFKAYTEREQLPEWWGLLRLTTVVDKLDVTVGGNWRVVQTEPDGTEHAFHGVYKEIDEPNKLSYTFEYEPLPGHVLEETVIFEAQSDDQTKLTSTAHYANVFDLDGMVAMGMEQGALESQQRLALLVEKPQTEASKTEDEDNVA